MTAVVTPPLGDVETLTQTIAAAIGSQAFTDLLAAVDAARNQLDADGALLTTPTPAAIYAYERRQLDQYPAVEIIGLQTVFDAEADEAAGQHRIAIDWTQVGDTEATVTRDVQRLVLATRLLVRRAELGGAVGIGPVLIEYEDYSALSPAGANPFVKGGRLVLAVSTWSA